MARAFTSDQKALLRSPDLQVNVLATFFLDAGTYRFCDDNAGYDLYDGVNTYLGANTIVGDIDIRASQPLTAEQVTLICDGNRMSQAGVADPGRVLSDILGYLYQQRRVDFAFGFRYSYSKDINLVVPAYAGKINTVRLIDDSMDLNDGGGARVESKLEIVLDSLAMRYNRATHRTRSHNDQLEIDPTDNFYSFTANTMTNEKSIYWGKAAPFANAQVVKTTTGKSGGQNNRGSQFRENSR